jgi:hypothetical protein
VDLAFQERPFHLAPLSFARNPNVVDQTSLSDEDGQRDERFTFDPLQGREVAYANDLYIVDTGQGSLPIVSITLAMTALWRQPMVGTSPIVAPAALRSR